MNAPRQGVEGLERIINVLEDLAYHDELLQERLNNSYSGNNNVAIYASSIVSSSAVDSFISNLYYFIGVV